MTSQLTEAQNEMTSRPLPHDSSGDRGIQPLTKEELDRVLRALEIPFDVNLVQWRVTEWHEDGTLGLMMPYADPRAYSDRLNNLFTPQAGRAGTRCRPAHRFSAASVGRRRRFWLLAR